MTLLVCLRRAFLVQPVLCALALLIVALALACVLARAAWAAGFGVETFTQTIESRGPWPATQAGSHPYALTTTVVFDHAGTREKEDHEDNAKGEETPTGEPEVFTTIYGDPRDLTLNLPAGMVVNPAASPVRCTEAELETSPSAGGACPAAAAVGVATIYASGLGEKVKAAVYAMEPPPGVPAELGVDAGGVGFVMHITGRVRPGDYGFTAEVLEIGEAVSIYGLQLTLWGEPSDPGHDAQRGVCAASGPVAKAIERELYEQELAEHAVSTRKYDFTCPTEQTHLPLLTLPGTCTGRPLETTLSATSWQSSSTVAPPPASYPPITGCASLPFTPSLEVTPEPGQAAESPSGLSVALKLPREESTTGLAQADLRDLTLTLPAGMAISPATVSGLEACAQAPSVSEPESCPNASKLGEVEVRTPLLAEPLRGDVYLAQPEALGPLVGLYLVVAGDGISVELAASVATDPLTGQLTVTLDGVPQLPLEAIALHLFGGPRAALQTPAGCGAYTADAQLTPWSGGPPAELVSRPFTITSGCPHGFAPSFTAGAEDTRAGAFTPFTVLISRGDGEQRLGAVQLTAPPGLSAVLGGVSRCPDAQAGGGECPAASRIGEATLALGPGADPYWVPTGAIYLTGPYGGAPLGLAIVFDVRAGPFDLGRAVVRARMTIDPHTARLQIDSDSLPTILDGVPLDIRTVALSIDRPYFLTNPTDCSSAAVTGALASSAGATVQVSSPFAVSGCAGLPFTPTFIAYTSAHAGRAAGASLSVRVGSGAGQANIARLRLILPSRLPGRLSTLQHACPAATFDADPADCPAASDVGRADVRTRVLPRPLTGPAYLVSHGGASFPDLVFVLAGEGFTIYLDGALDISHGLISATFDSIPDLPIDSFAASFPEGPHSILAVEPARAREDMCGQRLFMPVEITAHDGALYTRTSRIVVTGCPRRQRSKAQSESARARANARGRGSARTRDRRAKRHGAARR